MFSLFIREKVRDLVGFYPDLQILTTVVRSSTLAKLAGPFSLASLSVSQLFPCLVYYITSDSGVPVPTYAWY